VLHHKEKHSESVDLRQGESGLDPESVSGVRPHPDFGRRWLPEFNGDFLVKWYVYEKIFMKIRSVFSQRYEPNRGKMTNLATLKNPSKNSYS